METSAGGRNAGFDRTSAAAGNLREIILVENNYCLQIINDSV